MSGPEAPLTPPSGPLVIHVPSAATTNPPSIQHATGDGGDFADGMAVIAPVVTSITAIPVAGSLVLRDAKTSVPLPRTGSIQAPFASIVRVALDHERSLRSKVSASIGSRGH
jgi:hypothetical protein